MQFERRKVRQPGEGRRLVYQAVIDDLVLAAAVHRRNRYPWRPM